MSPDHISRAALGVVVGGEGSFTQNLVPRGARLQSKDMLSKVYFSSLNAA